MTAGREVVSVAIYPSIGVARWATARASSSTDRRSRGPNRSTPTASAIARGGSSGPAARFRLYGFDASGEVVREITAKEAEITWSVHVANTKAAWFQFDLAMDIPAARGEGGAKATVSVLRNPQVNSGTAASS